ncbi:hypothetical protein L1049_008216 [Liquidambar formosana]|uniref:Pentatricopeptide repeat-containing protein n=1 Tax=Liquidambar formosana TaxID=63359 RepID=A0AAP0S3Y0_LIQFO
MGECKLNGFKNLNRSCYFNGRDKNVARDFGRRARSAEPNCCSRMKTIFLQECMRKKPSSSVLLAHFPSLQTPSNFGPFSFHKLTHKTENKKLDKPLRILDLTAPKRTLTANRQSCHLRLIQEFLQIQPHQFDREQFNNDVESTNMFDETLEPVVNKERVIHRDGLRADASVLSRAVSSCASTRAIRHGVQLHCLAITTGFIVNVYIGSSLISLYGKCGELKSAYRLFEEMPVRNVVSWTAIIAGFAQEWQVDVCLELYHQMRNSTSKPNDFTFVSLLSACTGSGSLGQGRSAHCQTIQMGFDSHIHIVNALISMYCKCGNVNDAFCIFESMGSKDIVSWNSMIAGYAQHGLALQAIDLFERMKKQEVKPDGITFLGLLSSCRHVGLVKQGQSYFNSMIKHGVKPELDHYSCVVDLLGRAGLLEEARDFIEKMPIYPNAIIWGSLLSCCRLQGSVWLGIQAAESRILLEPWCAATHLQLANLYASVGCWDKAARVRKLMKDKGLKTNPGYSWIEIRNEVYRFGAEGRSNTKVTQILTVMDSLVDHMTNLGYVPEIYEEIDDDSYTISQVDT